MDIEKRQNFWENSSTHKLNTVNTPEMLRMLGQKIYEVRNEKGLSPSRLSRQGVIQKQTLKKWEFAVTTPSEWKLSELSEYLGFDFVEYAKEIGITLSDTYRRKKKYKSQKTTATNLNTANLAEITKKILTKKPKNQSYKELKEFKLETLTYLDTLTCITEALKNLLNNFVEKNK